MEKKTLIRGSRKGHLLGRHDVDIQSPIPKMPTRRLNYMHDTMIRARDIILKIMNDALKDGTNPLTMSDFHPSKYSRDSLLSKNVPVEWKALRRGPRHGDRGGLWHFMMDIDDMPPDRKGRHHLDISYCPAGNGPDRPHVGYKYRFEANHPLYSLKEVTGHVFVDWVSVGRTPHSPTTPT